MNTNAFNCIPEVKETEEEGDLKMKYFIFILAFSVEETLSIFLSLTPLPITALEHTQLSAEGAQLKCQSKLESTDIFFKEQK